VELSTQGTLRSLKNLWWRLSVLVYNPQVPSIARAKTKPQKFLILTNFKAPKCSWVQVLAHQMILTARMCRFALVKASRLARYSCHRASNNNLSDENKTTTSSTYDVYSVLVGILGAPDTAGVGQPQRMCFVYQHSCVSQNHHHCNHSNIITKSHR
jgi:hypothetical protein